MSSHRRSIPALERLKTEFTNILKNHHNPLISAAEKAVSEEKEAEAKRIRKAIEEYVLKEYPHVTLKLKCEPRSSSNSESEIVLGFNIETTCSKSKLDAVKRLKENADNDRRSLEQWYVSCLGQMAVGDGLPEFEGASRPSNYEGKGVCWSGYI